MSIETVQVHTRAHTCAHTHAHTHSQSHRVIPLYTHPQTQIIVHSTSQHSTQHGHIRFKACQNLIIGGGAYNNKEISMEDPLFSPFNTVV